MGYGPQIPGLDRGANVNLAAPGPIGGTSANSGAFTTLTASSTLGVTEATTLTGGLNLGPQSGALLTTTSALTDYKVLSGGATLTLGTEGPSVYGSGPIAWFRFTDAAYGHVYFPVWGSPPP